MPEAQFSLSDLRHGQQVLPEIEIHEKKYPSSLNVVRSLCDGWSCCNHIVNRMHTIPNMPRMAGEKKECTRALD